MELSDYGIFKIMELSDIWNCQIYGIFKIMEYLRLWNI